MSTFYNIYRTFHDFYETILRGNEVEFAYDNEIYHILPYFHNGQVIGAAFGKNGKDCIDIPYLSQEELYNAKIGTASLRDILSLINIVWYNF